MEEGCYGSIIMSSPWHRGKDLGREWGGAEFSYISSTTSLQFHKFVFDTRQNWIGLLVTCTIKAAEKLTQYGDVTQGFV